MLVMEMLLVFHHKGNDINRRKLKLIDLLELVGNFLQTSLVSSYFPENMNRQEIQVPVAVK